MANRGAIVEPLVGGAALKGATKTATFTTDGFSFNRNGQRVGIWLDLTVGGTGTTIDTDVEVTMDGTTYGQYRTTFATEAEADMDQITATGAYLNWFENPIPFGDDTANYKMRLEFTMAGTTPSAVWNECKVFCWTPGQISLP